MRPKFCYLNGINAWIMKLSETWFVEGRIDFEMQQYRLLAYLQDVEECFHSSRLYPQLSDLVGHYNNLISFRKNKQFLQDHFPKNASLLDLEKAGIIYQQILEDDGLMQELQQITSYATERMKPTIEEGTSLYEEVENTIHISPVGINPPYNAEGYLFLRYGAHAEIWVYQYSVSLFEQDHSQYRGLRLHYLDNWQRHQEQNSNHIKKELVKNNSFLKNPAVYELVTDLDLPLTETILPVAKRCFIRYLATNTSKL